MVASNYMEISHNLREAIAKEMLKPLSGRFASHQKIYFIVDTSYNDADFLEEHILMQIKTQLGEPYAVDYAIIGSGITLVQDLLAMIFLKSEFPLSLLKKKQLEVYDKIFRVLLEKRERPQLEIVQKFLECKHLSNLQRQKLGINFDLSDTKNAIEFFRQCVNSYAKFFNHAPIFYFRNLKFNKDSFMSQTTIKFIKTVQRELPCAFIFKVQKDFEYMLLYVEGICDVIRLSTLDSDELDDIIARIHRSLRNKKKLDFTNEGLKEFCNAMHHIYGKTISASALVKALSDLEGHATISNSNKISAEIVKELFSVDTVKIKPPIPREPRASLSPYFANEVERLTRQCEAFGLNPHYSLPWNFRNVLKYIVYGCLKYCRDEDTFQILKYIQRQSWLKLDSSLRSMGYRYVGNGKWAFSPRK
jgi:hypothetical protein